MPTSTSNGIETWRLRTSKEQWIRWVYWLIGIAIIMYAWQMISEKTVWFFVTDAPSQAADIASRWYLQNGHIWTSCGNLFGIQ